MLCARVINGIGTGYLNAIVPVWSAEVATHTSRGESQFPNSYIALVFLTLCHRCFHRTGVYSEYLWCGSRVLD